MDLVRLHCNDLGTFSALGETRNGRPAGQISVATSDILGCLAGAILVTLRRIPDENKLVQENYHGSTHVKPLPASDVMLLLGLSALSAWFR